MVGLIAIARIIPHPWNFTPIGAVGFLGAYYCKPWWLGMLASLGVMVVSDSVIGFYHLPILVAVYGSFMLYAVLGRVSRGAYWHHCEGMKYAPVLLFAFLGSFVFFIFTNSAVWLFGTLYPHHLMGWISALVAGVPFYRNMMLGDSMYIGGALAIREIIKYARVRYTVSRALL